MTLLMYQLNSVALDNMNSSVVYDITDVSAKQCSSRWSVLKVVYSNTDLSTNSTALNNLFLKVNYYITEYQLTV